MLLRRLLLFSQRPLIIRDTFSRPDSVLSAGSAETGQVWQALLGTWGISAGQLYIPTPYGSSGVDRLVTDLGRANIDLSVTFVVNTADMRLLFRFQDVSNEILFYNTGTKYSLSKRVSSTLTELGAYSTVANGDIIRVRAVGSNIRIWINSIERISVTETALMNQTKIGFSGFNRNDCRWDNLQGRVV